MRPALFIYSGSEVSLVVKRTVGQLSYSWTINIYAAGKKIATRDRGNGIPQKKTFEVSDYLGNLRNVFYYDYYNTLQLGEAIWYNPFGKQDSVKVAGTDRHRFTYNGKEFDEGTELSRYYYGARYYDPELGRFMTPDPISDDWTPYSYVRNNPIMNNDPTGMMAGGGSGFSPGADPCPGFDMQAKDPFALLDAGKMQMSSWAVWSYLQAGGGGPTGGNESRKLTEGEKHDVFGYALLGLVAYFASGGTEGMAPDDFEQFNDMLDADKIRIGDTGMEHGWYNTKTGIATINKDDWKKLGNPGSKVGVISYLFHEVGHAMVVGSGDFTERYTPPPGSTDYGNYDRKGWDTQLTFWRFISKGIDTSTGLNSEINQRYKKWNDNRDLFFHDLHAPY